MPTSRRPRVAVYCASRLGDRPAYAAAASDFGALLGRRGVDMVFGGAGIGLMGLVADAALEHGCHVLGVLPDHMADREIAHDRLSELRLVADMTVRKRVMFDEADAVVALPGGVGTLEELVRGLVVGLAGAAPQTDRPAQRRRLLRPPDRVRRRVGGERADEGLGARPAARRRRSRAVVGTRPAPLGCRTSRCGSPWHPRCTRCWPRPSGSCPRATCCTSRSGTASAASCSATATRSSSPAATNGPLTRYFPELLDPLREQLPDRCVIDGELVVPTDRTAWTSTCSGSASTRRRRASSCCRSRRRRASSRSTSSPSTTATSGRCRCRRAATRSWSCSALCRPRST